MTLDLSIFCVVRFDVVMVLVEWSSTVVPPPQQQRMKMMALQAMA
jgi:hypothetical protein